MRTPRCTQVPEAARYRRKAIRAIHYDGETLIAELQGEDFAYARVVFAAPVGFRVLDERDLAEFWPAYSEPHGWLYEVHEGGWLELERQRGGFSSPDLYADLREYLLVDERCLSVLCCDPPRIVDVGRRLA